MKQVYWCVGKAAEQDEDYHLLQPMFSSSLAQVVHQELEDARFGEQNKLARQARRENKAFDAGCRDYPDLAVRKLGGTKPQNISHLNSERRGENYLLSSLPPSWKQQPQRWLNIASVLPLFQRYEGVPALVKALLALLAPLDKKVKPVMETKIACEKIEQALGEALAAYGLSIRASQPPGWTRDASCRLELCEKLWLDPERASLPDRVEHEAEDQAFRQQLEWKDWPDQVAHRFGDWLNDILRDNKLPVGETEQAHWAKQAIVDAEWPTTMQRRALPPNRDKENGHA
jgi:CRISPR-associated protein Csy1